MAQEVHGFDVTIPAGTPKAAPQKTLMDIGPRVVERIQVIVPPGPRGLVGFQLGAAGQQMLPVEPGTFFVTDNEKIDWPVEDQITSGAWQLIAYNTGTFPHTLEVRFLVRLPAAAGPGPLEGLAGPAPDQVATVAPQLTGQGTPLSLLGFGPQ